MQNKEELINLLNILKKGIDDTEVLELKENDHRLISQARHCGFIENDLRLTPIGVNYLRNNSACFN